MTERMPDFLYARPTPDMGAAVASLERLGVAPERIQVSAVGVRDAFKGEVVGQSPAAGSPLEPGGEVVLYVAREGIAERLPRGVLEPLPTRDSGALRTFEPEQITDFWERQIAAYGPGRQLVTVMERALGRLERDLERLEWGLGPIGREGGLARRLLELAGIEPPDLSGDEEIYLANVIHQLHAWFGPVEGVGRLAALLLRVEAEVDELPGDELELPSDQRHSLGEPDARLGENVVLGPRFRDPSPRLRIRFGPLRAHRHRALDADPRWHERVEAVLEMALAAGHDFDYELVLDERDRGARLGDELQARLGRSSYLGSRP